MQIEMFTIENPKDFPCDLKTLRIQWVKAIKERIKALDSFDVKEYWIARDIEQNLFSEIMDYSDTYKVFAGSIHNKSIQKYWLSM